MLLALIAGSALGTMPLPQFTARAIDVSQANVLVAMTAPAVAWADLTIDATGRLIACTVPVPSGSTLLDHVACARATKMARFAPARDEAGQPVAARVRQGFAVNRPLPAPDVDFALVVDRAPPGAVADLRVVADPSGKVETCAVDASSGSVQLDKVACAAVIGVVRSAVRDAAGTPIRAMSRVSVGFSTSAVSPK